MRLIAVSTVRNEADIVEAFVRHTATFTQRHLIVDHGSTDGTDEILDALAAEGMALDITRFDVPGAYQAERLTELAREACDRHGADWVIPLDADEFLVTDSGKRPTYLLATHTSPVFVTWVTYVPDTSDDAAEPNPVLRLRRRRSEEPRIWEKVIVPASYVARHDLAPGSHNIIVDGRHERWPVLADAHLAHFPIRSPEQWATKVAIWSIGFVLHGLDKRHGSHLREALSLLIEDWDAFKASYIEAALRFALKPDDPSPTGVIDDPIPYLGGPLRYARPQRSSEPLRSIIEYALDIARHSGKRPEPHAE